MPFIYSLLWLMNQIYSFYYTRKGKKKKSSIRVDVTWGSFINHIDKHMLW